MFIASYPVSTKNNIGLFLYCLPERVKEESRFMKKLKDADRERLQTALNALSNVQRFTILTWLAEPKKHFPAQLDGDLVEDGVCVGFITEKIGLSQPTVTTHMQALARAGLVTPKKIKNWVYYKLNDAFVERFLGDLARALRRERKRTKTLE
jgi:DNA-binding transcriptional ArsR family regulator